MRGRIIDLNRLYHIIPSGGNSREIVAPQLKTINEIVSQGKGTFSIPAGIYTENVILEDGVSILGNGIVKINGTLIVKGNGIIDFIECENVIIIGKRDINRCTFNSLNVNDGYINCKNSELNNIKFMNSQFVILNCVIHGNSEFSIDIEKSFGLIESSTIEGSTLIKNESVLECKQTSVVGSKDLFIVEDYTSTVQLFNCVLYGNELIKSGAGTSIRANCVALSNANQFEGGENIKIESV